MKAKALLVLLEKLAIIGYVGDAVQVDQSDDGLEVKLDLFNGNRVTILIHEFWRYPTLACYFVNFNHVGGDFSYNMGTPYVEQALFDIGNCFAKFVQPK